MNWRILQPKFVFPTLLAVAALTLAASSALGAERNENSKKDSTASATAATGAATDDALRMEGERRFHANCGRCHTAPPKFSPRMVATIVRHMRVRATITDEEARLILHYMSE
jgi:mono/diheme cytochrome c family protein